jgi:predicted metal-dependent hydrolase
MAQMTAAQHGGRQAAGREVPVRRIELEPSFATVPKHFARDGDLLGSHFVATLSAVFPEGEKFFIRSVKHYRDRITDPVLKEQVSGFIGQEVVHGREHHAFNEHLATLGYPTMRMDRFLRRAMEFRTRRISPMVNLASTAALEHFTATLAEFVMTSEQTREAMGHDAVRDLFLWHALEESEHKAVAFDVYRAVGGTEPMRIITMKLVRYSFVVSTAIEMVLSLLRDRATYRPGALRASWRRFRRLPIVSRAMWEQLKEYERPGFHPDDRPTDHLIQTWREQLFGRDGAMLYAQRGSRQGGDSGTARSEGLEPPTF